MCGPISDPITISGTITINSPITISGPITITDPIIKYEQVSVSSGIGRTEGPKFKMPLK